MGFVTRRVGNRVDFFALMVALRGATQRKRAEKYAAPAVAVESSIIRQTPSGNP